ncbi:receptor-like protein EIX2 [Ipomoea triloba]|uniref:receptor-like protein EIX2 n=1 Tax=Ipomoea triloba TaxID=35885 RepID=UPI00125D704B|nr:receptor-like protein EIX2 [Ipomoea triloba]
MMSLHALQNLNVSRNNLSGAIPKTIGNLSKIESLDLSRNELSGPIPPSLSSLNFLSHLNLSFNHLYGRIPTGSQLQTLNDPSIYMGNEGLCGDPLSKGCPNDVPSFVNQSTKTSSDDDHEFFMWFYAGICHWSLMWITLDMLEGSFFLYPERQKRSCYVFLVVDFDVICN